MKQIIKLFSIILTTGIVIILLFGVWEAVKADCKYLIQKESESQTALPIEPGIWDVKINGHDYIDVVRLSSDPLIHSISPNHECELCKSKSETESN